MNISNTEQKRDSGTPLHPYFIMELKMQPWQTLLVSAGMMLVLILIVVHFSIPNPNMILIAGLVVSSAVFGYSGGLLSGALMLLYSMYFFSTDHSLIHYTSMNFEKLIVILIGIVVVLLFVCELKRSSIRAFREVEDLTAKLQEDNLLLQEISLNDALTGIRNRLALRRDFPTYIGDDVCVMMLDVDNFKSINDQYGHDQGDRILRLTAHGLADRFGTEHCYRYGGDEFLVICPEICETDFRSNINSLVQYVSTPSKHQPEILTAYSVGYVFGRAQDEHALRSYITTADERMYKAKRSGKNQVVGE